MCCIIQTSSLFRLLSRLAGIDESDSNLIQLAYSIAPTICRPINSAYMSIRHMEDLRRIRPVISFIMENYEEVFSDDLVPNSPVREVGSRSGSGGDSSLFSMHSTEDISNLMSTSMVIDTSLGFRGAGSGLSGNSDSVDHNSSKDDASISSMDESVDESINDPNIHPQHVTAQATVQDTTALSPRSLAMIRPNLLVTIPPPSAFPSMPSNTCSSDNIMNTSGNNSSNTSLSSSSTDSNDSVSGLQHYSDAEWSVSYSTIEFRVFLLLISL